MGAEITLLQLGPGIGVHSKLLLTAAVDPVTMYKGEVIVKTEGYRRTIITVITLVNYH